MAETLSFRKAAELCGVSQPSLSAQLAALERALGVPLFERRRRVLVTGTGEELLGRIRNILLEADDLADAARRRNDPLAGALSIGVIPTVSPYLLPRVAGPLHRKFPRLTVRWVEEKTDVLVRRLEEGRLDAALLALEADIGDLESEVVARDPFVLITPRDHPLGTRPAPATPAELAGADVLLLDDGHCFRKQALAVCSRARARELAFRATSLPTLVQMVASGAGVTLLPALALPTEAKRSDILVRPFAEPAPHRTLALVWRKSSPLAPGLRQIAAAIRKAYPDGVTTPSAALRADRRARPRAPGGGSRRQRSRAVRRPRPRT